MEDLNQILNAHKLPILLSLVGVVLIIGGLASSGILSKPKAVATYPKQSVVVSTSPQELKIDVSGSVVNPGVYAIPLNSRVEDAIKAAGGFSPQASSEYISKTLNLSQKISDGMKIYVPAEGELVSGVASGGTVAGASTQDISINTASESDLDGLPGIGPVTAQKIIDGRPYSSIDDLKLKKIISSSIFEKIKDRINAN